MMANSALAAIARAIAALTYDAIERVDVDDAGHRTITADSAIPLLHRSIAQDLLQIESAIGARGKTLLSANAAAIDEALIALEEARQVLEAAPQQSAPAPPASADNVKPARFFLTPPVVQALIDPAAAVPARAVEVPIGTKKLVDRPRRSEDPRLSKANDDDLQPPPGGKIRSGVDGARGAVSGNLPVPEAAPHPPEPGSGRAPATDTNPRRGKLVPQGKAAGKSDAMHRQAKDRDAREREQPVDRLDLIRSVAKKLALPATASDCRPLPGVAVAPPKIAIPPLPAFARRQRLLDATMYLKRRCILVTPVDRSALVMRYRVSGKRDPLYAEDVIAIAIAHGFEAEGAGE